MSRGDDFGQQYEPADSESNPEGELTAQQVAKLLGGTPFDDGLDFDTDFAEDFAAEQVRLSEREAEELRLLEETDWHTEADRVFDELMERAGEGRPEPRLEATRRACELLGDIHRAWPMIHITGTNGKTSTSRITESLLRAHGLRTGLLTSPHLVRLNERIGIDGEPISDERLVANWRDIVPFLEIVDAELLAEGQQRLTFFEALTVLAFACFADAPVDVAVVEVGMGGEWDSTNVADGQVAVLTPISLEHTERLGNTIAAIARTKSGIIKPGATVVSAAQLPDADREIRLAAQRAEAQLYVEPEAFAVTADHLAVGGRLISVRGIVDSYEDLPLALAGDYQAHNAALAIAAVEAFFGGERGLKAQTVEAGIAGAVSPGRLELVGASPTVLIDAAHNPHGAAHLAQAVVETYQFDELTLVLGVLGDKTVSGIVRPLAPIAHRIIVTQSDSPRAVDAYELAEQVREVLGEEAAAAKQVQVVPDVAEALDIARAAAASAQFGQGQVRSAGVLVTGSITLIGQVRALAQEQEWKPVAPDAAGVPGDVAAFSDTETGWDQ